MPALGSKQRLPVIVMLMRNLQSSNDRYEPFHGIRGERSIRQKWREADFRCTRQSDGCIPKADIQLEVKTGIRHELQRRMRASQVDRVLLDLTRVFGTAAEMAKAKCMLRQAGGNGDTGSKKPSVKLGVRLGTKIGIPRAEFEGDPRPCSPRGQLVQLELGCDLLETRILLLQTAHLRQL